MPDRNPRRSSNWKVVCPRCRAEFLSRETAGDVRDHFVTLHGLDPAGGARVELELVWVGRGPAPASKPKVVLA